MVNKSPEEGIKDLLVAGGVGAFNSHNDWSITIGKLEGSPNRQICIRGTGGRKPNPKWNIDYPTVQVRVRGGPNDWLLAWQKARDVKDKLLGLPSQNLNSDRWTAINMIGDITPMGFDTEERPSFVVNFDLIIEPSVAGNRST